MLDTLQYLLFFVHYFRLTDTNTASLLYCSTTADAMHYGNAGKHPCVARGVITDIAGDSVTLTMQRRIQAGLLHPSDQLWRLDKDEVSSNFTRMRKNVLGMFPWVGGAPYYLTAFAGTTESRFIVVSDSPCCCKSGPDQWLCLQVFTLHFACSRSILSASNLQEHQNYWLEVLCHTDCHN